jgi:hypothetical protein
MWADLGKIWDIGENLKNFGLRLRGKLTTKFLGYNLINAFILHIKNTEFHSKFILNTFKLIGNVLGRWFENTAPRHEFRGKYDILGLGKGNIWELLLVF